MDKKETFGEQVDKEIHAWLSCEEPWMFPLYVGIAIGTILFVLVN